MISYDKLFKLLEKRGISTYVLRFEWGIGSSTLERMKKNLSVSTNTLDRICVKLKCQLSDIAEHVPPKEPEPEPLEPIEEVPKEFRARFHWLMKKDRKRQADLVRDIGISRALISAYYVGKMKPKEQNQKKFAEYFNVDVDWIMGKE